MSNSLSLKVKIALYVFAWVAALIATDPTFGLWPLIYMFPLGLVAFINVHWGNDGGWGVYAACIIIYIAHGYFYFRSRTKLSTFLWLALLVVFLICNISGCHKMYHPAH